MSEELDLYEFKMALFYNGESEEFLLFIRNFNTTLEASGTLFSGVKIHYLRTLVRGEALHQLGAFSAEVVNNTVWLVLTARFEHNT